MKRAAIFFILISFVASFSLTANGANIKGKAENAGGKKLRLITYADMISFYEEELAETIISKTGDFNINIDPQTTLYCLLKIDYETAEFYIEPGKNYELKIIFDEEAQQITFSNPPVLKFNITKPETGLNQAIQQTNLIYNDFVVDNFNALYKHRKRSLLDTLKGKLEESSSGFSNKYFKDYIDYKIASIEKFAKLKSFKTIALELFINKPVQYKNIEYMDFFNQLFERYFAANSKQINWDALMFSINKQPDYFGMMDVVRGDEFLNQDERIREMVVLKTLNELYYLPGMNQAGIISILETASGQMKYEENRDIAGNLIKKLTKLQPGTVAPAISLPDLNGKITSLDSFEGETIYINFWNQSCKPCLQELDSIARFRKYLKPGIRFISILVEQQPETTREFLSTTGYDWNFLYFNGDFELLEEYGVRTLPANIIIGPDGKVLKYPGRLPGEVFLNVIRKYSSKED